MYPSIDFEPEPEPELDPEPQPEYSRIHIEDGSETPPRFAHGQEMQGEGHVSTLLI